jgi:hypothetical protein
MDEDEVKQILENDEIEKLLIQSCSNKDPQPQKVKKIRIVRSKKDQKDKDNKDKNKVEEKKEKDIPKKKPKPKPSKKEEESFSSSSSSGSESPSSDGGSGGSSSGSASSSGSSDSESSSSDSESSNNDNKKKKVMNKKITIDKKTLEDFENKQDNHLIMIFENEIKDQISNEEEIQILNSLNEAIEFQSQPQEEKTEDQSPIPFQIGDEINDEKFYTYVKECIKKIKTNWNEYSKQYLKNIIAKFRKTQNIFTYRRYLKEPFKTILTDFLLYIMSKDNLKDEDILKLAEPIIDKSWPVSVIVKDNNTKEEKKENNDENSNENNEQLIGKKKKRKGTYQDYSSSSSDSDDEKEENDDKKNNKEKNDDKDNNNNLGPNKKYEINEDKKEVKEDKEDKEEKEESKESEKMEEEEENEHGVKHVCIEQNLKEGEIKS